MISPEQFNLSVALTGKTVVSRTGNSSRPVTRAEWQNSCFLSLAHLTPRARKAQKPSQPSVSQTLNLAVKGVRGRHWTLTSSAHYFQSGDLGSHHCFLPYMHGTLSDQLTPESPSSRASESARSRNPPPPTFWVRTILSKQLFHQILEILAALAFFFFFKHCLS